MNGTQEFVTILPWTFIAQILNLFIQLYFIKRFLFGPINAILEKRKEMGTEGRKYVESVFDRNIVISIYLEEIQKVVNK